MLLPIVSALSLTFQDVEDTSQVSCIKTGGSSCTWSGSDSGGNRYMQTATSGSCTGTDPYLINAVSSQTTYAAATLVSAGGFWYANPQVRLYDSSMNILYTQSYIGRGGPGRAEVKIVGGKAYFYYNGASVGSSGILSVNPSYVGWGTQYEDCLAGSSASWDDIVYGSTENQNIFGSPQEGYFIKKDMINPASSGFCYPNGTVISNYNMTTTWGVGDNNASHTIQIKELSSGTVAGIYSTPTGIQGSEISWPIADDIINNPNAAYGFYITTIDGSGKTSTTIPYIGSGASVSWDSNTYTAGTTASITYAISSGAYWDLGTYTYSMVIADAYGNVVSTQSITTQTGSKQYTFTSSDANGVYYAELKATPIAGGNSILMNYAATTLTSYVYIHGYVMNAETTNVIIPAYVNITQGTNTANITTSSVGWNSSQSWVSGIPIYINTTASGYVSDNRAFTPISASAISLNISLLSTTPTSVGVSIGGIVRDTQFGNPIPSASVYVTNGSSYNTANTNLAGYYRVDSLIAGTLYNVWSNKVGYSNSSVAQKLAVGV